MCFRGETLQHTVVSKHKSQALVCELLSAYRVQWAASTSTKEGNSTSLMVLFA